MISKALIFLCCISGALLGCSERAYSDAPDTAGLKLGTYLREDYVQVLEKTKSARRASDLNAPQALTVYRDGTSRLIRTVINFHEGGAEFLISSDNKITVKQSAGYEISNLVLRPEGSESLIMGFDSYPAARYIYTENIEKFVAGFTIAGKYRDKAGKIYEFTAEGKAQLPDREFRYAVGLDHIGIPIDYIVDKSTSQRIAFERTRDGLTLWRVKDDEPFSIDRSSQVILAVVGKVGDSGIKF